MVGPQPTGPAPGPVEAVRRHAPGLRRTAVMLTGERAAADRLLVEVFARTPPSADRVQLLQALVRTYVHDARSRRRGELDQLLAGPESDADPGDVLARLPPRDRAATVLRRVERWSSSRTAEAVQVPRTQVSRMVPRTPGLEVVLEAVAERHALTAEEVVASVLARLPAPAQAASARATYTRAAPGSRTEAASDRRSWTWRVLAAAVALGLVVWVSALGDTAPPDTAVTEDGGDLGTGLVLADGTRLTTAGGDLAERGWTLDEDGDPPVDLEGLRIVEAVPIDLRRPGGPMRLDTRPRAGTAVFATLWCDLPVDDANLTPPAVRLGIGGEAVVLPCAGTGGQPPVERLVPLPPAAGHGPTTALVSWTGDVPVRGRALLTTYTEVGAGPAPVEEDAAVPPVPADGSVVLDGATPAYRVSDRPVHHQRLRVGLSSTVTVWAGRPGEISVQVDGTVVTDDGEHAPSGAGAWRTADPELRAGRWLVHQPGRARAFPMPAGSPPGRGGMREVTVAVTTSLPRSAWQVHVSDAEVVEQDRTPIPVAAPWETAGIPGWIGGYRLVAAWRVPNDGVPHALVDPGLPPGRRFLLVGTPRGTDEGGWGVVQPHVATTRGATELTIVQDVADAFDERVWRPGDRLVRAGASTSNIRAGTGTGVRSVTVPAAAGQTAPSTLLVYEPVRYEDFDFASAPPMGVSLPPGSGTPGGGTPGGGTVVAGRWTHEDLDDDGRLTIDAELPGRTWLRFTTEGPGRVQVLERGRPAVWLPEGWWTSWTAEPVVTEVRVEGSRTTGAPGQPFELVVEGYGQGFVVEALVRDGADGSPGST